MQTDRFIAHVNHACPSLDADVAHEVTLITLETLCEQLPLDQAKRLAAQLPQELTEAVEAGGDRGETSDVPITLAEFYSKLMFRTELEEDTTRRVAQAVASALRQAVSDGEISDVALDLPSELDQLVAA
ncbi:DUF2267 domain-containing protein [Salinisphaera orenii]|nr:DUF2267 domain-containing protein [Salinisphaera halophila]